MSGGKYDDGRFESPKESPQDLLIKDLECPYAGMEIEASFEQFGSDGKLRSAIDQFFQLLPEALHQAVPHAHEQVILAAVEPLDDADTYTTDVENLIIACNAVFLEHPGYLDIIARAIEDMHSRALGFDFGALVYPPGAAADLIRGFKEQSLGNDEVQLIIQALDAAARALGGEMQLGSCKEMDQSLFLKIIYDIQSAIPEKRKIDWTVTCVKSLVEHEIHFKAVTPDKGVREKLYSLRVMSCRTGDAMLAAQRETYFGESDPDSPLPKPRIARPGFSFSWDNL